MYIVLTTTLFCHPFFHLTRFYIRWKEYESMQVESLHYSLDEEQWLQDWSLMLSRAGQPGAALEQIHIFALAHILRRPIIVYGVKFIKSFRGENIGYARFQGMECTYYYTVICDTIKQNESELE